MLTDTRGNRMAPHRYGGVWRTLPPPTGNPGHQANRNLYSATQYFGLDSRQLVTAAVDYLLAQPCAVWYCTVLASLSSSILNHIFQASLLTLIVSTYICPVTPWSEMLLSTGHSLSLHRHSEILQTPRLRLVLPPPCMLAVFG